MDPHRLTGPAASDADDADDWGFADDERAFCGG